MKHKIASFTLVAVLATGLAACGGGPARQETEPAPVVEGGGLGEAGGARGGYGAETAGARRGGAWAGQALQGGEAAPLDTRTIYFEFDRSDILPEYYDVLRAHAARLIREPGARMVVEGHADERGSREYNIALGERRANAVVDFLEAEGVAGSQLATVSYGEERPLDPGHDESAWSVNRRAELTYE